MGKNYCRGLTTTTNDVSSVCDDVTQDQEDGWGGAPPLLVMNGRDNESSASGQAEGPGRWSYCLSSGSPLPMEFHSSSITVAN